MDSAANSPVYELLYPVAPFEDEVNEDFDEEFDDDFRDQDYIPDSHESDSDLDQSFIPVGLCEIKANPGEKSPSYNVSPTSSGYLPSSSPQSVSEINTKVDKKHYCVFCSKPQAKLQRHLLSVHEKEPDMIPFLTANGKERKKELAKLRNAGDHLHNIDILKGGQGDLVVKRRKRKGTDKSDYVPCSRCLGYFFKRDLWRHKCPKENDQGFSKRKQLQRGRLMIPHAIDEEGIRNILESLRNDHVSLVIKNDELIKLLCKREYAKNGHDHDRHCYIRNKLRELGRLVIQLRQVSKLESAGLKDFINPQQFQNVVVATRIIAGYNEKGKEYKRPSLAMKLGHTLHKCSVLLKAQAIERKNYQTKLTCEAFEELYKIKWEEEISSQANRTLYTQKKNTTKNMPLLDDVRKLTVHLKDQAAKLRSCLESDDVDIGKWSRLAEITLCQIILFNRRRQGEASKMKVEDYIKGIGNCSHNDDILAGLTKLEQGLCKLFTRVEITGKRGRTVPVILTNEMKYSIDALVEAREKIGINKENPFLFARANCDSLGHIRGSDTLRQIAHEKDIGLEKPETLRSTVLRKHLAAMTQLVNLQDNELDIVAQYMGHDIRVHRDYYRLPTATVQVAKVSKLLLAMSKGESDCPGDGNPVDAKLVASGSESETDDDTIRGIHERSVSEQESGEEYSPRMHSGAIDEDFSFQTAEVENKKRLTHKAAPPYHAEPTELSSSKKSAMRNMEGRKKWRTDEETACLKSFQRHIALSSLPGKADIVKVQEKEEALQNRTWIQIKNFVRNYIKRSSKQ